MLFQGSLGNLFHNSHMWIFVCDLWACGHGFREWFFTFLWPAVFLLRQLWIINYHVKSLSNNLRKENVKTGLSRETISQKIVHFGISIHVLSWRQQKPSVYVFITEIIWLSFDKIIDDPWLMYKTQLFRLILANGSLHQKMGNVVHGWLQKQLSEVMTLSWVNFLI